ncbi:hypothetical protein EX30DRAFT_344887 [Ascodesmis nigricans]|uniref:Uncharacterized protein n=1 Tax=Ascodesmis nigricans TaxID=341454 RepID=A0A4S2MHU7_9PEZI|nr:hypothetical protein EX30DRAFT_344887 [Ascodesmis nigricans]
MLLPIPQLSPFKLPFSQPQNHTPYTLDNDADPEDAKLNAETPSRYATILPDPEQIVDYPWLPYPGSTGGGRGGT